MPRPLIIATLLGASIGVPYVMSQSKTSGTGGSISSSPWPAGKATPVAVPAQQPVASLTAPHSSIATHGTPASTTAPLPGITYPTMEQVFRFDITKNWVYQRWARKSTSPTEFNLFAVRVALVTGTQPGSLAGSLTYFFNAEDQVEHISFRGRTGDATRFVQFITSTYQLQSVQSPVGEQLYQLASGGGVQSELRIRPEGILISTAPQSSLLVELQLARPGSKRLLPPRTPALEIPPDASASTVPPHASGEGGEAAGGTSALGSYFEKARYATPDEMGQAHWRRWPN